MSRRATPEQYDGKSTPPDISHLFNASLSLQELQLISQKRAGQRTPNSLSSSVNQRTIISDLGSRKGCLSLDDSLPRSMKSPFQAPIKRSRDDIPLAELRDMPPELSNDMLYHDAYAHRYPSQNHRPLIDLIRNEWQTKPEYAQVQESPDPYAFTWKQVLTARRLRRYVVLGIMLLVFAWTLWKWWLEDTWYEDSMARKVKDKKHINDMLYGSNMQPVFADLIQMKSLHEDLVPKKGDSKRLIFVADVHGCLNERKCRILIISWIVVNWFVVSKRHVQ